MTGGADDYRADDGGKVDTSSRALGRLGAWSVLDQCVFSGTNFLTAVLIGRYGDARELGRYSLAISLVMLLMVLQNSLLVSPYVVIRSEWQASQWARLRGSMLVACGILVILGLAIIPLATFSFIGLPLWAWCVLIPAASLRDYVRRIALAAMNIKRAFVWDLSTAFFQISALAWVIVRNANSDTASGLNSVTGITCVSGAWLLVAALGLIFTHKEYRFEPRQIIGDWKALWPVGRWVGLAQGVSTVQAYTLPWLMAIAHSLELAGIYAACWTLVQVVSPAIEGVGNLLGPILANSAAKRSWESMIGQAKMTAAIFAASMISLGVLMIWFGGWALETVYGPEYAAFYPILLILTLAATINNVGIPAGKSLIQIDHASAHFWISLTAFTIVTCLSTILLILLGPVGAAWGLVTGALFGSSMRWGKLVSLKEQVKNTSTPWHRHREAAVDKSDTVNSPTAGGVL
ncbi:MAG: lipopolysaccharide biosynthesis protein [Rubripirellula sp.]